MAERLRQINGYFFNSNACLMVVDVALRDERGEKKKRGGKSVRVPGCSIIQQQHSCDTLIETIKQIVLSCVAATYKKPFFNP